MFVIGQRSQRHIASVKAPKQPTIGDKIRVSSGDRRRALEAQGVSDIGKGRVELGAWPTRLGRVSLRVVSAESPCGVAQRIGVSASGQRGINNGEEAAPDLEAAGRGNKHLSQQPGEREALILGWISELCPGQHVLLPVRGQATQQELQLLERKGLGAFPF